MTIIDRDIDFYTAEVERTHRARCQATPADEVIADARARAAQAVLASLKAYAALLPSTD